MARRAPTAVPAAPQETAAQQATQTTRNTDVPGRTLLDGVSDAEWRGYQATLLALADAGEAGEHARWRRRVAAADALQEVDDLFVGQQCDAEERVYRRVGLALRALGYGDVWPAIYALSCCPGGGRDGDVPDPGDAERFLDEDDGRYRLPTPPLPAGWPGPFAPTRAADRSREDALRAGLALGAQAAVACHALADDAIWPDHARSLNLYDVYPDDSVDDAAAAVVRGAKRAWSAALARAAALPVPQLREGLAAVVRLQGEAAR